jgi:hypothetical protein
VGAVYEECVSELIPSQSGSHCLSRSVEGVAEMTALGLGLDAGAFKDSGKYGYVHYKSPCAPDN